MKSMTAASSPLRPGIAIISITSASAAASLTVFFKVAAILDDETLSR
jgi:hypothetical protein